MVMASGELNQPTAVQIFIRQALASAISDAIVRMAVGMMLHGGHPKP